MAELPVQTVQEQNAEITKVLIIGCGVLILLATAGFLLTYRKGKKINNHLKEIAYTDVITARKNDIYLKEYLKKNMKKQTSCSWAFISLEISNLKSIINMSGFKNIYALLADLYQLIAKQLTEKELIVHSYLGEYKLLLEYENMEQLEQRISEIFDYVGNKHIDLKMGVYLIRNRKKWKIGV